MTFGMGGGLLQKVNRDTCRFAFKCSAQKQNGVWVDISKNPLDQTKKSKGGRLSLTKDDVGNFITVRTDDLGVRKDYLHVVFEYGKIIRRSSFDEIRCRAGFVI